MTSHRARLVATAVVALAIVGGASAPASAHAAYKNSDPADESSVSSAPSQIWAEFTEPPGPGSFMEVFDECGEQVDAGDSRNDGYRIYLSMSGGRSGTYRVTFNVASATDSHVTRGEFTFTVSSGEPCPGDGPAELKEPRERERDREQPPNSSADTDDATGADDAPPSDDPDQADTNGGGGVGRDRDQSGDGGRDERSNDRQKNGPERDRSDDQDQAAAVDVNEPKEPGIFTGIPIGGLLAALLMAAVIGAGGGLIYAGIMGYRS
ncbi:MAG TPA: copper resistance CopC family protein [Actinomycetota bacterium]|nr:copper resistance CopC family protein [Actinomycetota bacterium]